MSKATSPPSILRFLICLAETKSLPVFGSTTFFSASSRTDSVTGMEARKGREWVSLAQGPIGNRLSAAHLQTITGGYEALRGAHARGGGRP
jgi:hypothetical protein